MFDNSTLVVLFLGLGMPLMGLAGVVIHRRNQRVSPSQKANVLPIPISVVLVVASLLEYESVSLFGSRSWLAPLLLAVAVWGMTYEPILRSFTTVSRMLRCRYVQFGALIAGGPLLMLAFLSARCSLDETPLLTSSEFSVSADKLDKESTARTDRGREITLFRFTGEFDPDQSLYTAAEERNAERRRIIKVSSPDQHSNCFGWVFTEGRYILNDDDVERIVADNGYLAVDEPQSGDLVVYRDEQERIRHVGRIYAVCSDGEILVESKWGLASRYLHPIRESAYSGLTPTCYHTDRGGHLLRNIGSQLTSAPQVVDLPL